MGGAIGLGNWTPSAEFNIFADPEAAAAVLDSGVPITLVPLEVTHRALATDDVIRTNRRAGHAGGRDVRGADALLRRDLPTRVRVRRAGRP